MAADAKWLLPKPKGRTEVSLNDFICPDQRIFIGLPCKKRDFFTTAALRRNIPIAPLSITMRISCRAGQISMTRVTITIEFQDGFHRQYVREVDVQREPHERPYRSADGTRALFLESGQLSIRNTSKEIFANAVAIEIADTQKYAIQDCTQYSDHVLLSILPAQKSRK